MVRYRPGFLTTSSRDPPAAKRLRPSMRTATMSTIPASILPVLRSVLLLWRRTIRSQFSFQTHGFFFMFFFEVPGDGFFQPFVKVSFRLVAELAGGAGDVSEGVLDVAGAFGAVDGLGGEAELGGDGGVDVIESVAFSC